MNVVKNNLANSADPNEMLHKAAFCLGHHCLLEYTFRGFPCTKLDRLKLLSNLKIFFIDSLI